MNALLPKPGRREEYWGEVEEQIRGFARRLETEELLLLTGRVFLSRVWLGFSRMF